MIAERSGTRAPASGLEERGSYLEHKLAAEKETLGHRKHIRKSQDASPLSPLRPHVMMVTTPVRLDHFSLSERAVLCRRLSTSIVEAEEVSEKPWQKTHGWRCTCFGKDECHSYTFHIPVLRGAVGG